MGLSGGSKSTSESGSAQKWAQPYATAAAGDAASVYQNAQPWLNAITNRVGGMLPDLQGQYGQTSGQALNMAQGFGSMLPSIANAAGNTYSNGQNLSGRVGNFASDALGGVGGPNRASYAIPYAGAMVGNQGGIGGLTGSLNRMYGGLNRQADQTSGFYNNVAGTLAGALPQILQQNNNNAALTGATNYAGDVLGGKYLNSNPYLQSVIDSTNRGVADSANSQFSASGRYGSGAHSGVLAQRLAENEGGLRFSDYNNQMARMDNAAAMAPTLAGAQMGLNNNGVNQAINLAGTLPGLTNAGYAGYGQALNAAGAAGNNAQTASGIGSQNLANYLNAAQAESGINNTNYNQAANAAQLASQLDQNSYAGLNPLLQTAGMVPTLNASSYQGLPEILNTANSAASLPYTGMQAYTGALGTLFNGGTQVTKTSPNIFGGIGSLLSGAGSLGWSPFK